jgi:hypothetical protein
MARTSATKVAKAEVVVETPMKVSEMVAEIAKKEPKANATKKSKVEPKAKVDEEVPIAEAIKAEEPKEKKPLNAYQLFINAKVAEL